MSYLVHQFAPSHARRDNKKYFTYRLQVVKKTQAKTKQNDNHDIHYANFNAKNVQKVCVNLFDINRSTMTSCVDKFIAKIRAPGCPLALFTETKGG